MFTVHYHNHILVKNETLLTYYSPDPNFLVSFQKPFNAWCVYTYKYIFT